MKQTKLPPFPALKAGLLLFLLILVVSVTACSAAAPTAIPDVAANSSNSLPTDEKTETEVQADPSTIEFIDYLDTAISIQAPVQRIVSLAPSVTEILFAIGAGPLVVGRTDYCNYPPEAEALTSVGGFASNTISVETILDLEPDIVIGGSTQQVEIINVLNEANVTAFVVQPASIEEILETILLFGKISGHTTQAQAVVDDMQTRIDKVTETVSEIPDEDRVRVFYEVWHEPLMTTTHNTFIGEVIEMAGGNNIFGELDEQYPVISAEQIIASDPQIIVGPSSHGDQLNAEIIAQREGWQAISAVQNEAIYILDGDIVSRPAPRIIDALEAMTAVLYPDLYHE